MKYGYYRYYTYDDKNIEHQKQELQKLGVNEDKIYIEEEGYTPTHRCIDIILSSAKKGDTIIITKASRLTISTKELCKIINVVKKKNLELIIGTFKIDCRKELDPMTEGMLKMADVFSEIEDSKFIKHIKKGMLDAKREGKKLGRPKISRETLPPLFLKYYHKYQIGEINQEKLAKLCETSRQSISKYIKIMKNASEEVFRYECYKDEQEFKKEAKKEEMRRKNIKKLTDQELEILAEDEATDVWQEEISEFTPYSRELERRKKKREEMENQTFIANNEQELDLSEFDD